MVRRDYHMHTTFSDGRNTPEEMVLAAIGRGMEEIGFSDHSHTPFDESYCMPKEKIGPYRAEIAALKEKYRGKIGILCGIEQDYFSPEETRGYDYVIGSVHYLKAGGEYISVDHMPGVLPAAAERCYGGDIYAAAEEYYRLVADVVRRTGADIIGHFDLFAKFNEKTPFFRAEHPRYRAAWQRAADELLKTGKPFEINTGAIARGYRTEPYPSREILNYLKARGAKLILSSDAHSAGALCCGFDALERELE